jgi:hypothetical protein
MPAAYLIYVKLPSTDAAGMLSFNSSRASEANREEKK